VGKPRAQKYCLRREIDGPISRFGRLDGPSISLLRQYFWALGFPTALLWSEKLASLIITCYTNLFIKSYTFLPSLHGVIL